MPARNDVLLIDSDVTHRQAIEQPLVRAGYEVDAITHAEMLAHVSREDMGRYAAIVVAQINPDASVTSRSRAGENVVQYLAQFSPEVMTRVILLTAEQRFGSGGQGYRVLADADAESHLVTMIAAGRG